MNDQRLESTHIVDSSLARGDIDDADGGAARDQMVAPQCMSERHPNAILQFMPSIQIKAVPEDVHAELRRRAVNAGQSLQEYLLARLVDEARRPSLDDLLTRAGHRSGGHVSFEFATAAVREDRDRR